MTCDEARERFSDRIDAALIAADAARLDAHLAGCAECRREWARFELTVASLRGLEPAHAPAGFVDRVVAAATRAPWYRRLAQELFVPLRVKLPLEAAAVLLVGGLAVMIFKGSPELQQAARSDREFTGFSQPATPAAPTAREAPAPVEREAKTDAVQAPGAPAEPRPAVKQELAAAKSAAEPDASAETAARSKRLERADGQALQRVLTDVAKERARSAPPASAPAPGAETETAPGGVARGPREPRAGLGQLARVAPPDILSRLLVKDRATALAALAQALSRAGGTEQARRADGFTDVVELVIPREAWSAFERDLHALGTLTLDRAAPERREVSASPVLRVTLRITE